MSQPDLSGALFVMRNEEQKAGTEGGNSCPNKIINCYSTLSKAAIKNKYKIAFDVDKIVTKIKKNNFRLNFLFIEC